jgi:hypothetical protein
MRKRNYFLAGGSFLVLLFAYFTDPNGGALTLAWLQQLTMPVVAVWFAYIARKALFDYLDMGELFEKAKQSTVGAAIVFLGICVVFFGLLGLFGNSARAQDVKTYIPAKALIHMPVLQSEQYRLWPDHPKDI